MQCTKLEKKLPPLHLAVVANDEFKLLQLLDQGEDPKACETHGFNALELAQFLGRKKCQMLLGEKASPEIKIQLKGASSVKHISLGAFERGFGVVYRPFLNFKTYDMFVQAIKNCPYVLRFSWLAKENHALALQFKAELAQGFVADVCIKWIDATFGYGIFAEEDISSGAFVGEYTGVVRRLSRRLPDHNTYCLHYPTRFWSWTYLVVDACNESNVLRFMNHSDQPNVEPFCVVDRGLLHQIFVAKEKISKGTQLTFDYGVDYWTTRTKGVV